MGKIVEMFEAEERVEKLTIRRQNAFRELAPAYIADIKERIRIEIEAFNLKLKASGRQVLPPKNKDTGVELFFRPPVPIYEIVLSEHTETLRVLRGDACVATLKLFVREDFTGLQAFSGMRALTDDEVVDAVLTPFALEVHRVRRL